MYLQYVTGGGRDCLFFSLSIASSPETWEDCLSIGLVSLVFSVLEWRTELQYYAAEARADMVIGDRGTLASGTDNSEVDVSRCWSRLQWKW